MKNKGYMLSFPNKEKTFGEFFRISLLSWVAFGCFLKAANGWVSYLDLEEFSKTLLTQIGLGFLAGGLIIRALFKPKSEGNLKGFYVGLLGGCAFSGYFALSYLFEKKLFATGFIFTPIFLYLLSQIRGKKTMSRNSAIGLGILSTGALIGLGGMSMNVILCSVALSFLLALFFLYFFTTAKIGEDPRNIYLGVSLAILCGLLALVLCNKFFSNSSFPSELSPGFKSSYLLGLIGSFMGAMLSFILFSLIELSMYAEFKPVYIVPVTFLFVFEPFPAGSAFVLGLITMAGLAALITNLRILFSWRSKKEDRPAFFK